MDQKIPLDASISRSHTMIRTKPTSPSPYLDPIVTRRRPSLKSGGTHPGRVSATDTTTTANKQLSFANKQLENYGAKGRVRSKPVALKGNAGNQYLQRRKTIVSVDCSRDETSDLAYLVVNLQDNIQRSTKGSTAGEKSNAGGCSPSSRRRNTMASTEIGDKSNVERSLFQEDVLTRRFRSTESIGSTTPTASTVEVQENDHEGGAVDVDNHHSEKSETRGHNVSSRASSANKKSSVNRPPPPPPPPYMPPSPPKRDFSFPVGRLAECSMESNRGSLDMALSCPNLPPKKRPSKKHQVGKTCSLGFKEERLAADNDQNIGQSSTTPYKKYLSEPTDARSTSNTGRRQPPHKPRPYSTNKAPSPSHLPSVSPDPSCKPVVMSKDVDGSTKSPPASPPVPPKKSSLSAPSAFGDQREGLTTSVSSPSLHQALSSPSKPNLPPPSGHARQHSLSIHPSSSQELRNTDLRRGSSSSLQHSPLPRRAPPRPSPFAPPLSSRPAPPPPPTAMLSSPELGTPTKKPTKKKKISEPAMAPRMKEGSANRETRSSTASVSGSLRNRIISDPILKSTTFSLDKSQPILSSVTDLTKSLLSKSPAHPPQGSATTAAAVEAIYEDMDKLPASPRATVQQPKPALPSRNRKQTIKVSTSLPPTTHICDLDSARGVAHGANQERLYEELDTSDSEECTTMDNAAYVRNLQEAWLTVDEEGLYVDDLYVEMRPASGSPTKDEDDASTYMEMKPTIDSTPSLQVTPPPTSPAPSSNSRDSVSSLPAPAPASPAPIYEYADLSVITKRASRKGPAPPHSTLASESGSLYYASKDLLTSK